MERIPEEGPVLLVGNHSGGNITPDTIVFTLAFNTYFGVERPFYQLAHNLVLTSPVGPVPAEVRHRRRVPGERAQGARLRRRRPRLSGRRLGGEPPDLGGEPDRLRRPQGLHQARPRRGGPDRPDRLRRRPGDGDLPHPRGAARQAAPPGQALSAEDATGEPLAALDRQRRRLPRPSPPARQDHGAGDGADRPAASATDRIRTSTGSTRTSPRRCRTSSTSSPPSAACPSSGRDPA